MVKETEKTTKAARAASKKTADQNPAVLVEHMYHVLRRPLVTEKTTRMAEHGHLVFEVPVDATKPDIKKAIEALYKVTVVSVHTIRQNGKTKRFRGRPGRRSDSKKAIVRLAAGQSIDLMAGVSS